MPPRIRRRPQAIADGLDIWLHIAADSMTAADRVAQRLDEAISRLADYPELGPERPDLGKDVRVLVVDTIAIFYRTAGGSVDIVRILHMARRITPDLLVD